MSGIVNCNDDTVMAKVKSKAPCWWCSKRLEGWRGFTAKVDGNEAHFHRSCLAVAIKDDDFKNRIELPEGWKP